MIVQGVFNENLNSLMLLGKSKVNSPFCLSSELGEIVRILSPDGKAQLVNIITVTSLSKGIGRPLSKFHTLRETKYLVVMKHTWKCRDESEVDIVTTKYLKIKHILFNYANQQLLYSA